MKKLLISINLLIFGNSLVCANDFQNGLLIFNKSERYDVTVIYNVCKKEDPHSLCLPSNRNEITIPAKRNISPETKNYKLIAPEEIKQSGLYKVYIISATEKDDQGNIVSSSNYTGKIFDKEGYCSNDIVVPSFGAYNFVIVLDDMFSSPYIVCTGSRGQVA